MTASQTDLNRDGDTLAAMVDACADLNDALAAAAEGVERRALVAARDTLTAVIMPLFDRLVRHDIHGHRRDQLHGHRRVASLAI